MKVVCIGGVALGPKAANRFKRLMPKSSVTIIDENKIISYGGCGIPFYISGEIENINTLRSTAYGTIRDENYFQERRGVEVLSQTRVLNIDTTNKILLVEHIPSAEQKAISYDKLVIGTGSSPKIPDIEGRNLTGVTSLTRLENASHVHEACASGKVKNAVIIGGGFIGIEVAIALAETWGINTSLVEFLPDVLSSVLSPSLSDMVENDLKSNGVNVYTDEKVERLSGENGHVTQVITNKRTLPADLVIMAVGFSPNTSLALKAGLAVDERTKAILVDEYLRTSDKSIYAGGDCVAVKNLVTGKPFYLPLGSLANRQGRVIGNNLANIPTIFPGAVGTWIVKIFKLTASGVGLSLEKAKAEGFNAISAAIEQTDHAHYYPEKTMMSLELIVDSSTRRILGLQGISANGEGLKARIDAVAAMLMQSTTSKPEINDLACLEIGYTPPFASAMDIINAVANIADNILSKRMKTISSREFSENWSKDNQAILDVRPQGAGKDLADQHPKKWCHVPLEEINTCNIKEKLPQDCNNILVMCNTGLRAYEAINELKQQGIDNAVHVQGGMQALIKRGKEDLNNVEVL